jgi:sugar lactone lactonase YvrE
MYDPGNRRLYCNDTFCGTWTYDVQADLSLANKRMLVGKEDADGMVLDADGNIWITGCRSGSITRVTPGGELLAAVDTPADAITQVRFGGADMRDVYINAVPIDGGDKLKQGELPTGKRSVMYRGRSEVPGRSIAPTRFDLG